MAVDAKVVQDKQLDALAEALRGIGPERLKTILRKNKAVQIRVSESDLVDMKRRAKGCGLTLTDYLTRLHYVASAKMNGGKKKMRE